MDTSHILQLDELSIEVAGRPILHDVSLSIRPGEIHVLFGPNGSGKTSLLMAIMGLRRYRVIKGRILFQGRDITPLPVDERARLGIGLMHQRPPSVRGIPLGQLAEVSAQGKNGKRIAELADQLGCSSLLARDVNVGFSGGEIKKAELLQLMAQRPALALIDEPDAGVDLDSIAVVGQALACCPGCGTRYDIFDSGGAEREAVEANIPFLGRIPVDPRIRERGDQGRPLVIADPQAAPAVAFREVASHIAAQVSMRNLMSV